MTSRSDVIASLVDLLNEGPTEFAWTKVQKYSENAAANADVPFCLIHEGKERYDHIDTSPNYRRRLTVMIEAWTESDTLTEDRSVTAANLLDILEGCIEGDRSIGGDAIYTDLISNEVFTASEQEPSIGVFLEISIWYNN